MIYLYRTTARRPVCACLVALSLALSSAVSFGQDQSTPSTTQTPDNSGTNKIHNRTKTADQQKENTSDREITAKIRRSVVGDRSLSTYAHNIKIIAQNGAVTLKGPVRSEEEKQNIASKATEVAGQDKVTNQLTVKQ